MDTLIPVTPAAKLSCEVLPETPREIKNAGTPDSVWLPWLAARRIRATSAANLCADHQRLVVVAPHPDDEVLACGGLLAMRAAQGLPVLVIAVTDGEASHGTGCLQTSAALGLQRARESSDGLRQLGLPLQSVARLGLPDGAAADHTREIVCKLRALLMPSDVLLTTWGGDGHPDHAAVSAAARRASALVGCRLIEAPVWMWHWAEPSDVRVPWQAMLALQLPDHAVKAKQAALRCHHSQLRPRSSGAGPVLMPTLVARAGRAHEYYFE